MSETKQATFCIDTTEQSGSTLCGLSLTEVFDSDPIFQHTAMLTDAYKPKFMLGESRKVQITWGGSCMAPVLAGGQPFHMSLVGDSGVGKTLLTHSLIDGLKTLIEQRGKNIGVDLIIIESREKRNAVRAWADIFFQLTGHTLRAGNIIDKYMSALYDEVNHRAEQYDSYTLFIFLDDVDSFVNIGDLDDMLFNLSRAHKHLSPNAFIGTIISSNIRSFPDRLSQGTYSSGGYRSTQFSDYNEDDLYAILMGRIAAFKEGVITKEVIRHCAKVVADRHHGDARRAMETLRIAGGFASKTSSKMITKALIDAAENELDNQVTEAELATLSYHDKLILLSCYVCEKIISENHELSSYTLHTGVIQEVYKIICKYAKTKPNSASRVSHRLSDLANHKQFIQLGQNTAPANARSVDVPTDVRNVAWRVASKTMPNVVAAIKDECTDLHMVVADKLVRARRSKHKR